MTRTLDQNLCRVLRMVMGRVSETESGAGFLGRTLTEALMRYGGSPVGVAALKTWASANRAFSGSS
jgi:hypothetical protein